MRALLRKLNAEQKSLVGFGAAIITLLTLLFFVFFPMLQDALVAMEQGRQLQERLVAYHKLASQKDALSTAKLRKEKLQYLERRLPATVHAEAVMENIYALADEMGVKLGLLKQIKYSVGQKQGATLHLECSGSYESLLKFLDVIENEGSFKNLDELFLKGEEGKDNLKVTATLTAYKN